MVGVHIRNEDNMFGLLEYRNSCNLGDEIQTLAAAQFLPKVDALVDRDTSEITWLGPGSQERVRVIYNGWFDGQYSRWPPGSGIEPMLVSFHVNETDHSMDSMYDVLRPAATPTRIAGHRAFLKLYEPIGCRDTHTEKMMRAAGIKTYWSGCMTLTLRVPGARRGCEVLAIDVHRPAVRALYRAQVPEALRCEATELAQTTEARTHSEKMTEARALVERIAGCRLLITSRLHAALIALANNVPVFFVHENMADVRFSGYERWLCALKAADLMGCDLANWAHPEQAAIMEMAEQLRRDVARRVGEWRAPMVLGGELARGVSIVSVCMNRSANLAVALPSWLASGAREVVIVDWGSKPPIGPMVRALAHGAKPIVRLVTVSGVERWVLTKSFNLAARCTTSECLVKVDADSMLKPGFVTRHALAADAGAFYAGDWRRARNENEQKTNGVMVVRRNDFFRVGGYNELIETYGYDDCDLYGRLEEAGIIRQVIDFDTIAHLPHSNEARGVHQKLIDQGRLDIEIEANRLLSEMRMWPARGDAPFARFGLWQHAAHEIAAEYRCGMIVAPTLWAELAEKARQNRTWARTRDVRRRLYIHAKNGLGNRLRAFCSALVIGRAVGREVVLIWVVDEHCGATWDDLFEPVPDVRVLDRVPPMEHSAHRYEFLAVSYSNLEAGERGEHGEFYNYDREKDAYVDDALPCDIFVASACVLRNNHTNWHKETDALRNLQPKADVLAEVDMFCRHDDVREMIGVHVRMGQAPETAPYEDISGYSAEAMASVGKWRGCSHWQVFANEMARIMAERPSQQFFVCCDREDAVAALRRAFGNNVVTQERSVYDRSVAEVRAALIDLLLLARTRELLGSNWSSFTEIAHRLSGRAMRLAGINF